MGWLFKGKFDISKVNGPYWVCDCGDWADGFRSDRARDHSQDWHVSNMHAGQGWVSRDANGRARFRGSNGKNVRLLRF